MVKTFNIFQPRTCIEIKISVVNIGLGWDFDGGEKFDIDDSVTAFDIIITQ